MIAASDPHIVSARAWVPLDDHHNLQFVMRARLDRPVTEEERRQVRDPFATWGGYVESDGDPYRRFYTRANLHNDYLRRLRAAEGADHRHPVPGQPAGSRDDRDHGADLRPDAGAPGHDRRHGDLRPAPADRRGPGPARPGRGAPNVDDPRLCRVRPASALLPDGASWISATEKARQSDAGVPIAWVPFV